MNFFLTMNPPTATAQEKQVRIVRGKPLFYDPSPVKKAKKLLIAHLLTYRPDKPFEGAVSLSTVWLFPKGKSHSHGEWRTTRPDTDNLQKMLKDCMTKCGFWKDDAQVVRETVESAGQMSRQAYVSRSRNRERCWHERLLSKFGGIF